MRLLTVGILILTMMRVSAQEFGFKSVDSTSYALYTLSDWRGLVDYGEKAERAGVDYYYFNLRIGIAHFELRQYHAAERYLKKALSDNDSDLAKEYLFWTYYNVGQKMLAERVYDRLSTDAREKIAYKKTFLEFVYLEGGTKVPTISGHGNIDYGFLAVGHRVGPRLRMMHSYTHYQLRSDQREMNSDQYNFLGTYPFSHASLNLGFAIASTRVDDDYTESGTRIRGNTDYLTSSLYLDYVHRIDRLQFGLTVNYAWQDVSNRVTISEQPTPPGSVTDTTYGISSFIPSVSLSYTPKLAHEWLSFGADGFMIYTGENKTFFSLRPFLQLKFSRKLWLRSDYLRVGNYLFSDKATGILYIAPDRNLDRFTNTLSISASKNLLFNVTYILEDLNNEKKKTQYYLNSFFLGLMYKF